MSDAVESMAYAGKTPWHRLGTRVAPNLRPLEMQRAASLDWKVKKIPLGFKDSDGHFRAVPTARRGRYHALVRKKDNALLDVVSRHWKPVQNSEAFAFFEDFIRAGDMTMEAAGSLQGGRRVFALAKLKDGFRLARARKDVTESYLLFTNPHLYGHAVDIRFTPVRVVCMNTLTLALGQKDSSYRVSFSHYQKFDVTEARALFRAARDRTAAYQEQADFLAGRRYDRTDLQLYFGEIFKPLTPPQMKPLPAADEETDAPHSADQRNVLPLPRNALRALEIVERQPGAEYAPGTWWNAFNAVTYLTDHEIGRDDTRLGSAWYGHGKTRKLKALNLALEYAEAA